MGSSAVVLEIIDHALVFSDFNPQVAASIPAGRAN